MTKDQVLSISTLTQEQREMAIKWFRAPANLKKEMKGSTANEIKEFLNQKIAEKKAKEEKKGSLSQVTALVKSLCKGTRQSKAQYTYNDIIDIINEATAARVKEIESIKELEAQLKERKAAIGMK